MILIKAFYAGFLLLHYQEKLEASVDLFQWPLFTIGINLSQNSFINLIVMIIKRCDESNELLKFENESLLDFN